MHNRLILFVLVDLAKHYCINEPLLWQKCSQLWRTYVTHNWLLPSEDVNIIINYGVIFSNILALINLNYSKHCIIYLKSHLSVTFCKGWHIVRLSLFDICIIHWSNQQTSTKTFCILNNYRIISFSILHGFLLIIGKGIFHHNTVKSAILKHNEYSVILNHPIQIVLPFFSFIIYW